MTPLEVFLRIDAGYEAKATRVTEWGTERVLLLGDPGERLFAVVHTPSTERLGTVLICSSLFTDNLLNYRREVELSRLLAAQGWKVGRFHYRGTGHSEGDPLEATYSTMLADALLVMQHLTNGDQTATPGLVGARWGALVAAGVARQFGGSPIAVWEPALKGGAFFSEALQASGVAHLTAGNGGLGPKRSLESTGVANILGFPMGRALQESGQELSFVEQLGGGRRDMLYLAPERNGVLSKGHTQAVEELRANELDVAVEGLAGLASWWFVDDSVQMPLDAAATTAQWFKAVEAR